VCVCVFFVASLLLHSCMHIMALVVVVFAPAAAVPRSISKRRRRRRRIVNQEWQQNVVGV